MTIGERIRSLREGLNMTQTELAHKVGYSSKTAINKIENGTNKLKQEKIEVFATALNVDPLYLLGIEESNKKGSDSNIASIVIPVWNREDETIFKQISNLDPHKKKMVVAFLEAIEAT